jgi:arylformamidase
MVRLIDISPLVSERIRVWPGDVPYSRTTSASREAGDSVSLSALRTTLHLGAHLDAPSHCAADAPGIDEMELGTCYGDCQVVAVAKRSGRIRPGDLDVPVEAPRVLFRTGSFTDPERWTPDFASLSAELNESLHPQRVRLVGIDPPSSDQHESEDLPAHRAAADHDIAILEGLVLEHVAPGRYTLAAFPLRLEGADASPVRAVLIAE